MFTRTRTYLGALATIAVERQRVTDAITAFSLAAVFTRRSHEREVTLLRGEAVSLRNEIAALKGLLVAAGHTGARVR